MNGTLTEAEPRVLERPDHPISRQNIGESALKVLTRLDRAGYKGYLVGGAVRDLMLGGRPKDYDIATDARPGDVRRLFRNSRVIGRRFRLAHVFFQDGIVEVATFRRVPDPEAQKSAPGELLITDDNVFGNPREDAFRRDFTVNALFYDVGSFSVIDYVGGVDDLEARLMRIIGDADVRFQEDPVRMMRACELAARLDFGIERETLAGLRRNVREMDKAAPARVTEEILQLLRCGAADPAVRSMESVGLLSIVLPEATPLVGGEDGRAGEFDGVLRQLDRLIADGQELTDVQLLGALLLPQVLLKRRAREGSRPLRRGALRDMVLEVLQPFFSRLTVAKQRSEELYEAFMAFHRFGEEGWTDAERTRFAARRAFGDAFGLLEILVGATGVGQEELEIWRRVPRPKRRARSARRRPRPRRPGRGRRRR